MIAEQQLDLSVLIYKQIAERARKANIPVELLVRIVYGEEITDHLRDISDNLREIDRTIVASNPI